MPARIQQLVAGILFVALTIVIIAVIGQPNVARMDIFQFYYFTVSSFRGEFQICYPY